MLTQEQLKGNIDSMQSQGAAPSDIQGYLDSLKTQPSSIGGDVIGAGKWLANAVASPSFSLGTHLAEATAPYIAKATDALGITKGEQAKVAYAVNKPFTTMTGGTVQPLKGGIGTALQLAGDMGSVATMAAAPEATGVLKMGLLGAASGGLQDLSTGDTNAGSLFGNAASGAVFGGLLGGVTSGLAHGANLLKGLSGVTPQIENELQKVSPGLVDQYFNAAVGHEGDVSIPSAYNVAENEFDKRAGMLTNQLIPKAGEALGAARDEAGKNPIVLNTPGSAPIAGSDAATTMMDNINNVMQKLTRHQFTSYASGEDSAFAVKNYPEGASSSGITPGGGGDISPLPGRSVDLSPSESKQLQYLADQMNKLKENPTLAQAMDVKTNLNTEVGKWKNPQFGSSNSPVQGVMRYAYGQVAQSISDVSPAISKVTDAYSSLENLKEDIASQAGSKGQRASLLMRRVLSGDKSSSSIPVLQRLDEATASLRPQGDPSLVSHSVLSDWANRNFGGTSSKTLFSQATTEGASLFGYTKGIISTVIKESTKFLLPDKVEFAKSIASGNPEALNLVTRLFQKVMDSSESVPLLGKITKSLNDHGINPNMSGPIMEKLLKTALFERLTSPN